MAPSPVIISTGDDVGAGARVREADEKNRHCESLATSPFSTTPQWHGRVFAEQTSVMIRSFSFALRIVRWRLDQPWALRELARVRPWILAIQIKLYPEAHGLNFTSFFYDLIDAADRRGMELILRTFVPDTRNG